MDRRDFFLSPELRRDAQEFGKIYIDFAFYIQQL